MPSARLRLPTRPLFLLGLLIILALVPIWGVRYLALHDYYHHLLEAQVVPSYWFIREPATMGAVLTGWEPADTMA